MSARFVNCKLHKVISEGAHCYIKPCVRWVRLECIIPACSNRPHVVCEERQLSRNAIKQFCVLFSCATRLLNLSIRSIVEYLRKEEMVSEFVTFRRIYSAKSPLFYTYFRLDPCASGATDIRSPDTFLRWIKGLFDLIVWNQPSILVEWFYELIIILREASNWWNCC